MKTTTGYFACAVLALVGAAFTPACSSAVEEGASEEKIGSAESALKIKSNELAIQADDLASPSDTKTIAYSDKGHYLAYKFSAAAGDKLDIWVRATSKDPVAWVLNNAMTVVADNDDAAPPANLNSHITFTAKAQANSITTHYLVIQEFNLKPATFTVSFTNVQAAPPAPSKGFYDCKVDADCVATSAAPGCCNHGTKFAVAATEVAAWDKANACTPGICAQYMLLDNRVAECNNGTHTCEMVAPSDIVCQAYSINSHSCPAGYNCAQNPQVADIGGKCVETCGGFTGKQCSGVNDVCVDDPNDSCDPAHGGADCGGICQSNAAP